MFRFAKFIFLIFSTALIATPLITVFGSGAWAATEDIFRIVNVPADATAEAAADARERAIREAQREALTRLLDRLTLIEDREQIPYLDDAKIAGLVDGLSFDNERYSSKRYLAKFTIDFSPEGVRELLRLTGTSFSETQARNIVLLPVFRDGESDVLWERVNPWRDAWRMTDWRGNLLPFVVPQGKLSDIAAISVRQALARKPRRLNAIGARYETSEVLLARAVIGYDARSERETLEIQLVRTGLAGEEVSALSLVSREGETRPDFLVRATRSVAEALTDVWKRQTLVEFSQQRTLLARAPLESLSDWLELRGVLERESRIRKFNIESLSTDEVVLTIHYLGVPSQLAVALAQKDIELADMSAGMDGAGDNSEDGPEDGPGDRDWALFITRTSR